MRPLPRMVMVVVMVAAAAAAWASVVAAAAQPRCDPITQYERGGKCCKLCPPGTSMPFPGTCEEPQCRECGEREYQDAFTTEAMCKRQPYCDPNANFQVAGESSKDRRTVCACKPGFHCSSEVCKTCVPHTTCRPGHGAQPIGNSTHDTVCVACRPGTFSSETSWDGVCKEWTECGRGYLIQQSGTDQTDTTCEQNSRRHLVVIGVVALLIGIVLVAGILCWVQRGKIEGSQGKVKNCLESCLWGENEPATLVRTTLIADPAEGARMLPEALLLEDHGVTKTPEENEHEPEDRMPREVRLTDRGNVVLQEIGKSEILSRQESQCQASLN